MEAATHKSGIELKNDAIVSAYETLKAFDGDREIFRLLEAVRCLEYIFGSALRSALSEVRQGIYAGSRNARKVAVGLAVRDVEEYLSYWGYID